MFLASVSDLHKCSQISHLWHETTARILGSRKCFAYIRRTCKNVCNLNYVIGQSHRCLINALSIKVKKEHESCQGCHNELASSAWTANLMRLPLRALDLYVSSCDVIQQVMHQIVLGARNTLEELVLTYSALYRFPSNSNLSFAHLELNFQ